MGVRTGQGYGQAKPKRRVCPECSKRGVTQWKATEFGFVRHCQYCQMAWSKAGWDYELQKAQEKCGEAAIAFEQMRENMRKAAQD